MQHRVGQGTDRPTANLEADVARRGLGGRFNFLRRLAPRQPVLDVLRRCDLAVQPSLTEGLPRSLIEAMALGLPCIGSNVGGIPELLDADDVVEVGDSIELARTIDRLAADPESRRQRSDRNRRHVHGFRASESEKRFRAFHELVRDSRSPNVR